MNHGIPSQLFHILSGLYTVFHTADKNAIHLWGDL